MGLGQREPNLRQSVTFRYFVQCLAEPRVTILCAPDGRPSQASTLGFKGNEITYETDLASTAEYYRPQLLLYSKALSRMLQTNASQVKLQLLFTDAGVVCSLL